MLFTRLLIPVDFSEPSREALKLGVTVAMRVGARLTLLFVDSATVPQSSDKIASALKRWIAEDVPSSVHAEVLVLRGSPAEQINQQASRGEHDLVVMGTHGKQGLERIVLGSVAETVVRTCPVPVLVTHDRG